MTETETSGLFDAFLEHSFLPLYGITVLVALWRYPKYFDTPLKYFPILLMYTFLTELLGGLINKYDEFSFFFSDLFSNYNWLIYNMYNFVFFLYFYYVFRSYLHEKPYRRFLLFGAFFFVGVSILNAFLHSFSLEPQAYAYVAGAGILLPAPVFYALRQKEIQGKWFRPSDLVSWIGLGLFIFYLGYTPIKIIRFYNAIYGLNDSLLLRRVHLLLILILYSCFIVGFLKMGRKKRA